MPQLYEYHNIITGPVGTRGMYGALWQAQTFTPSTTHTITSLTLGIDRGGAVGQALPGIITVSIRATDGSGYPTGEDLCSGTTDGDTLPLNVMEWRGISLGDGCVLNASTKYAIAVRAPSGDVYNFASWWGDYTSPIYAGGITLQSLNSGVDWTAYTNWDLLFKEWGIKEGPFPMHFRQ